jgi:hypothetical protein
MPATSFDWDRWRSEFETNSARIEEILARNPGDMGSVRPFEGAWSVVECIEHLRITTDAYLPQWRLALAGEDRIFGSPYPFWLRWFLGGVNDTAKIRSQTPAAFVPGNGLHLEVVVARYLEQRELVSELAKETHIANMGGAKIASPFASWMKYPLDFSFDLWIAHERRHLTQAEKG